MMEIMTVEIPAMKFPVVSNKKRLLLISLSLWFGLTMRVILLGINECEQDGTCDKNAQCIDKIVGYQCKCNPGYEPSPENSLVCVDINECKKRPCSQICRNTVGSYSCSCVDGFVLKHDNHSCKANSSKIS